MKTFIFAFLLLSMGPWAGAQQVTLLEDEAKGDAKIAAPVVASTAAPAGEAAMPVKRIINKKKKSAAKAVTPAAAKAQPAPAADFPFEAVKPEEIPSVAAPVKPAEPVKPAVEVKPAAAKPAPLPAAAKPAVVQAAPAVKGAGFAVGKTHTVTGGDTLWDLSNKYYHDPYRWGKIYNANLGTVENPDLIYPKEELVIPDLTEEVKPASAKAPELTGGETVKEADFSSSDISRPAAAPAAPARTAQAELSNMLKEFDANDLSEEMPEHQKEWSSGVYIVPESWKEDGVITSALKGNNKEQMENSISISGDMVSVSMKGTAAVKKDDYLVVYMKGATAFDKAGEKIGREIQQAGTLQVTSADGRQVKARVIEAVTGIIKGHVVKKK